MKSIFIMVLLGLSILDVQSQNSTKVKSNIKEATVFISGAHVTRKATVTLPKGQTILVFDQLTTLLEKGTMEVQGHGDFTINSVNHRVDKVQSEPQTEKVDEIKDKIEIIDNKIEEITIKMNVLDQQTGVIQSAGELAKKQELLDIEKHRASEDYISNALNTVYFEKLAFKRETKQLTQQKNELQQQLDALKIRHVETTSEVHVVVSAEKQVSASFDLSYFVPNARWYPEYVVKLDDINKPLHIDYKAQISQQSGEDWNNVKLTLSTSEPNKSGEKPSIAPWYVSLQGGSNTSVTYRNNFDKYTGGNFAKVQGRVMDEYGEPIPFVNVFVVGTTVGAASDFDGNFSITLPSHSKYLDFSFVGYKKVTLPINSNTMQVIMEEDQQRLEEFVISKSSMSSPAIYATSIEKSGVRSAGFIAMKTPRTTKKFSASKSVYVQAVKNTNVVDVNFVLEQKYVVKSTTESFAVKIQSLNLPVKYQYYSAPKLDKDVFLTALITDWESLNLLQGKSTIFYQNTFVGESVLNTNSLQDTLTVSLGRDKNIIIDRVLLKDYAKRKLFGDDIVEERKYEIIAKNNKNYSIDIMIEDQFPISNDKRIAIENEASKSKKVDENTGIVTWEYTIAPKKIETMSIQYSVTYPKSYSIGL